MSDIAIAAVLAGTVLLASTVSVEIGLSVALIELFAGFVVGNALHLDVPELAQLPRLVRRHRAHVPGRGRGGRAAVPARVEGVALDRARLVLRAVRGRRPARLLRARLGPAAGRDRRPRALDDEPRRRVRGARRDRAQPRARRQAADVGDVRHGHRDRRRADDPVHQADDVDRPVRARLDRAHRRPAARLRRGSSAATATA